MAEGDGPSRNFRSAYYKKLGFCGNDEKNILDLLIASSLLDSEQLEDLSERFDLDRRCLETWKVALGVECGRKNPFDENTNVRRVRAEHFQSLKHHLEVLIRHNIVIRNRLKTCSNSGAEHEERTEHLIRNSNQSQNQPRELESRRCENNPSYHNWNTPRDDSPCPNIEKTIGIPQQDKGMTSENSLDQIEANPSKLITLMYLLEAGRLDSAKIFSQLNTDHCRKLSAMASFFVSVSSDLQEAFFIFRNFTRKLEENGALQNSQELNCKNNPSPRD